MNLVIYSDYASTLDLSAKQSGVTIPVLGGYAGLSPDWRTLGDRWQAVLAKNHVAAFDFAEFAGSVETLDDSTSSYYLWCPGRRQDFLLELVALAGDFVRSGGFPFGCTFQRPEPFAGGEFNHQLQGVEAATGPTTETRPAYSGLFRNFFATFALELNSRRVTFPGSVSFVFSRNDNDPNYARAATEQFELFAKLDSRVQGIAFEDKTNCPPLQLAGLVVHRFHQLWENEFRSTEPQRMRALQYALWGDFKEYDDFKNHVRRILGRTPDAQ